MSTAGDVIGSFIAAALDTRDRLEQLSAQALLSQRPGDGLTWFFRKIGLNSEFTVEKQDSKTILIVFPIFNRSTQLVHRFRFELTATPAPPIAPASLDGGGARVHLSIASFMLTADDDQRVRTALQKAMRGGQWTAPFQVSQAAVSDQAGMIVRAPENGRGPVAFQIEAAQARYLVVDVNHKGNPDGIYVYSETDRAAQIYNMPNAGQDRIAYGPLHRFALAVRAALFRDAPAQREASTVTEIADIAAFVEQLTTGYINGRSRLSAAAAAASVIPVYYDIGPLTADLEYAASFDPASGGASAITTRFTPDPISSIEGTAKIVVSSDGPGTRTDVTIDMPTFVLSGENLALFLSQAHAAENDIVNEFSGDSVTAGVYRQAIRSQDQVVALQAFHGSTPSRDFLVVWPGALDMADREFVFTCHMPSDGSKLERIHRLVRLGDNIAGITLLATDDDRQGNPNQYLPFHNMFHAVLIWLSTLRSQ